MSVSSPYSFNTGTVINFQAVYALTSLLDSVQIYKVYIHLSQWAKITLIFKRILGGRPLERVRGSDIRAKDLYTHFLFLVKLFIANKR